MSYEEAQQEAAYDEFVASLAEELYDEHRDQAIEEFITERLQSYYERNSSIQYSQSHVQQDHQVLI